MRAVTYGRVSSEEQLLGYSLDAQSRANTQFIAGHNWELVREYVDEGKSARYDDVNRRPDFKRMIADAEAHDFDVIVVHKLDRFARNVMVTLSALKRLNDAGVAFVSVSEQMDFTTPIGKVLLTLLAAFAQYYSDNLSHETSKGKRERKLQGYYNGVLPFGYVRAADKAEALIDEHTAQGVVLAFQEALTGRADTDVAQALNAAGFRTTGNRGKNLWTKDSVRVLLTNRFYLGELPGGIVGKHPALVERELFDQVQQVRAENRKAKATRTIARSRRTYSLSGLLVCGYCLDAGDSRRPKLQMDTQDDVARVRCASRAQGLACPQRSYPLDLFEAQIEDWLARISIPDDAVERALAESAKRTKDEPRPDQEKRRLESRLARLKEMYGWGDLDRDEYMSERDRIVAQLRAFAPVHRQRQDLEKLASLLRSAATLWTAKDSAGKHELIVRLVEKIVVKDNQVEAIIPRPDCSPWLPGWAASTGSCGSDGEPSLNTTTQRYHTTPHNIYPAEFLKRIAQTAREANISEAARIHGVTRPTVRRALGLDIAAQP